ncbi:DNA primase [Paenibacillus yanchengensis]|uniref:DNA primase n=1 Tax=Paenibacillus yanchengensis TaxID=2035833 RepID=A0ABW4YK44_9BACL
MSFGRIPEEVIAAVRAHYDIVETVGKYVHLTKHGKYLKGLCPFHSENTPSFTVTPELQIFHCYGCGKTGNVIRFMEEIEGYSFPEAVQVMAEQADLPVEWNWRAKQAVAQVNPMQVQAVEAYELSAKFYHYVLNHTKQGNEAKQYLKDRGMNDHLINQFQIGFAPDDWDILARFLDKRGYAANFLEEFGLLIAKQDGTGYIDRFRNRVIFPIQNFEGQTIAFAGRILGAGQPKYLNSPESDLFTKSRTLYNWNQAKGNIRKTKQVVLFEGYMDVIKATQAGLENGVATMGTALTEEHCALLKRQTSEVIICYDGDEAGQAATAKAIALIEATSMKVLVAMLPKGLDPDDYISQYGASSFLRLVLDESVSATKFKLIYLRRNHILLNEEGRKNYLIEAINLISEVDTSVEREFYLKELSHEFDISLAALKQDCNEIRQSKQKNVTQRDNNDKSWNNGRNENRKRYPSVPTLLPAYAYAERRLLHVMIQDRDIAETVHARVGEAFNIEDHAAIAAYLYAHYAQGYSANAAHFMETLQDDRLESIVASILMMNEDIPVTDEILEAFVQQILKVPEQKSIDEKKEAMKSAERAGDALLAAQIASEIITLEQQLKRS